MATGALASTIWLALPVARRTECVPDSYPRTEAGPDRYAYEMEGYVHLFGSDPVVNASMRAADVLLAGNSRIMQGLAEPPVREFFQARGLRYYYMGFARGLRSNFCEELIRRHDLRPKWIVINADGFFCETSTDVERELLQASRLRFWQDQFEQGATLRVLPWLHHWYPRMPVVHEEACWRSRTSGAWTYRWPGPPGRPFPANADAGSPGETLSPDLKRKAIGFNNLCDAQGIRIVLTYVPTPAAFDSRRTAELLAQLLKAPLITPVVAGMESFDNSHLTEASAAVFTKAWLADLPATVPDLAAVTGRPGRPAQTP